MENTNATGNYYTIGHLVQFTGLTDRTIRSYIASGILEGEKINGLWHFTPEQTEAFIRHPSVRPSILAKNNGIVCDFLLDDKKSTQEICVILDLPGAREAETAEFFCDGVRNCSGIRFSFDSAGVTPRIILKGGTEDVLSLLNRWQNR